MNLPKLDIPESGKTEMWMKQVGSAVLSICSSGSMNKKADMICWNMYNKELNKKEFEYLYKEGNNVLPAKVRMLGYQRSYCNVLISQQARRPFPFSVVSVDNESIKRKYEKKVFMMVERSIAEMNATYMETSVAREKLQMQREDVLQRISVEPQSEEQAAQIQQLKMMMPEIDGALTLIDKQLERAGNLTQESLDEIENYASYSINDITEEIAIGFLKKAEYEDKVKKASVDAFRREIVTGKHYYYVDIAPGRKTPIFKVWDEMKVYFPGNIEVEFTHELPWLTLNEGMSYNDVINKYGHKLDDKARARIKEASNYTNGSFLSVPQSGAVDASELVPMNVYSGAHITGDNVSLWRIFFKAPRKIHIKYNKSKYNDEEYFRHIVSQEDIDKEVKRSEKDPNIKIETRYIDDLYEIIITQDGTFIEGYKRTDAVRDIDDPSKVFIPVFGRCYSGNEKPYSLIWATRDIEILIAIITYYKELLIATAGVKGQIIDLSQKPKELSQEEQTYHRKKGSLYIETVSATGKKINPSFNQWREYDDTISASVQYLDLMIDNLDKTMGRIMGIAYQRLGERQTGDQVGTYQMATEQSALVTEIIYDDFDEVLREALTHYVRILSKYTYKDGGFAHYNHMSEGSKILRIPEKIMKNVDLKVVIANSLKNEHDLRELKQHAFRSHEKGILPFHQLVSIHGIQNVKTLEKRLEYFSQKAEQLAGERAQQNIQAQAQAEKEIEQFKAELEIEINKQKGAVDELRVQVEAARLQLDKEVESRRVINEEKKIEGDQALKAMEVQSNNVIEAQYLGEMGRSARVNERLRAIEIQLQAIINSQNIDISEKKLNLDASKESNRHSEVVKKISTESIGSVPRKSRNNIKD